MQIPKPQKPVRLCGKKLQELNNKIRDRDGEKCVVCLTYVDPGVKFHHVIYRSQGGSDSLENGVTLCPICHSQVHTGRHWQQLTQQCKWYLEKLYCKHIDSDMCKDCMNELCEGAGR